MNSRTLLPVPLLFLLLPGCKPADEVRFQGYVEGEPVLVAAQQSGQLTSLTVPRGDQIKTGTPLFSQDKATEVANVNQARAQLTQARANGGKC